jgi:formate hydrogenlyase subunit 3/multisubunit Na+/H+ antiporter MnhD subunit
MTFLTQLEVGACLALAVPLALCVAAWVPALRPLANALAPWAALPALALALNDRGASLYFPDLVLGTRLFRADSVTQTFLLLTAVVWTFAGWASRAYLARDPGRHAYWGFYLASLAGNLGVVLAQDLASFYGFLMLMTFASLGLVLHERTPAAHRAGVVYLVMSVLGETLLLALILLLGHYAGNAALEDVPALVAGAPERGLLVGLIVAGFGVKAGLVPLHLWLPLAHPVAPTPASAVLSGAMIKAGLLGWLRFLPLEADTNVSAGSLLALLGLFSAYYGAAIGVMQTQPKAVLAYSSVSQMGFMMVAVGAAWASGAEAARGAVLLFALHHALAKGALFLGVSVFNESAGKARLWVTCGLALSALEITGAPLTSGAAAKAQLSAILSVLPDASGPFSWAVSLAAVGSTLLMLRFGQRLRAEAQPQHKRPRPGLWLPWALLLTLDLAIHVRTAGVAYAPGVLTAPTKLWEASWPLLVGALAAWLSLRARLPIPNVPPGDILVWIERPLRYARRAAGRWNARLHTETTRLQQAWRRLRVSSGRTLLVPWHHAEERLRSFEVVGVVLLGLLALLLLLAFPGSH